MRIRDLVIVPVGYVLLVVGTYCGWKWADSRLEDLLEWSGRRR